MKTIVNLSLGACFFLLLTSQTNAYSTLDGVSPFQFMLSSAGDIIVTIAGTGESSFSGDNGPASNAALSFPYGIFADDSGNVFVVDHSNHRIRKIDTSGNIVTIAGNGNNGYNGDGSPATEASLNTPNDMWIDSSGNIFIADTFNHRVRKIDPSGIITTVVGNGEVGYTGDGGPATEARLNKPFCVFMDTGQNLYIADSGNNVIRMVNSSGTISTVAGTGEAGYSGDGDSAKRAKLHGPTSVFKDASGNLYITDAENHVVRKVLSNGNIITLAGTGDAGHTGDGGPANLAMLAKPSDIYVDDEEIIWIADTDNNVIRRIDSSGTIDTVVGNGSEGFSGDGGLATSASLNHPLGIFISPTGRLLISDTRNHRIRTLQEPEPVRVDAGSDQIGPVGIPIPLEAVALGGDGSYQYQWTIRSGPDNNSGQLSSTIVKNPTFTPHLVGTYVLQVTVDDENQEPVSDTVTIIAVSVNPFNSVIVTDTVDTDFDLSNNRDYDPRDSRELVVKWHLDSEEVDTSDILDVHIYVIENEDDPAYLGRTGSPTAHYLEWRETQSPLIASDFQGGPEYGKEYRFQVFVLTRSGSPLFYGPFMTLGPVEFVELLDPTSTPTQVPQNTDTPVPTDTPSPTPPNTATVTPLPSDTKVPTGTPVPVPTNTSTPVIEPTVSPEETETPIPPEPSDTPTITPSSTATNTVTATETPFPTSTPTPIAPPETITLSGTVRDFLDSHPDFEGTTGAETGIVESQLGEDGKPVFNSAISHKTVSTAENFDQWYNDVPGVNMTDEYDITLTLDPDSSPENPIYNLDFPKFFPIDGKLFGNQGRIHNYHFTFELHTLFTYRGPQEFRFSGDDDVWVFIDNQLVIDLGGVHAEKAASVNTGDLGLEIGQTYPLDFFFAERHTRESHFRIETGLFLETAPTPTPSNTPISTSTHTPTNTPLPTDTPTQPVPPEPTNTVFPANTATPVPTLDNSITPIPSDTPSATPTVGEPSLTPTSIPSNTPTNTITPSPSPAPPNSVELTVDGPAVTGELSNFEEEDWYRFSTSASVNHVIEVHLGPNQEVTDTQMYLYGPDNHLTLLAEDDDGGFLWLSRIEEPLSANHIYYVKIIGFGGVELGPYTIDVKAIVPTPRPTATPTNTRTPTPTPFTGDPEIRVDPLSLSFIRISDQPQNPPAKQRFAREEKKNDWKILLKTGTIETEIQNENQKSSIAKASRLSNGKHFLIQFHRLPSPAQRRELESKGIRLLHYVPNMAYWASIKTNRSSDAALTTDSDFRWLALSSRIDKLAPEARGEFPLYARLADGRVEVAVTFFEDVSEKEAVQAIESAVGESRGWNPYPVLLVAIDQNNLKALASLDIVEWVEPKPAPYKEMNAVAAQRIHVSDLYSLPYNLNGKDILVGVWDGGKIYAHPEFGSRMTVVNTNASTSSHATHVGGTIGASGAGRAAAKGMAPNVFLRSYDWDSDTSEMRAGYTAGIRLSNHSYGYIVGWNYNQSKNAWEDWGNSSWFGNYMSVTRSWDDTVYDTGLIVFKSAGNDRNDGPNSSQKDGPYDCLPPAGVAKNIITIGATTDLDGMTSFSSWGPTDDGRVKPDICANGDGLYSTLPNNGYGSYSGTSMASPSACGAGTMLFQRYVENKNEEPAPHTLKALLIHGAQDRGRPGPDYEYGWGLIDASYSTDLIDGNMWRTGSVTDQTFVPYQVSVSGGTIKVTLVWTDTPGSTAAAKALVNDLDLVLRSPSGTVYRPWILNKENPTANATTGVNDTDNVEQVIVSDAQAGMWTIEVRGTTIPEESVEYTLVSELFEDSGSSQSFRIYNDGTAPLNVSSITVNDGDWIYWSPEAPFEVLPGSDQKITVSVNYDLAPYGETTNRMLIESDDPNPDHNPYPDGVFITVNNNATPTPTPPNTPTNSPTPTASDTPTATSTPIPSNTPVNTPTPVPSDIPTPLPPDVPSPTPASTATPEPAATATPEPIETSTPIPDITETPEPDETSTPIPDVTTTPIPDVTETPISEATSTPIPDMTETPLPEATSTPEGDATSTPTPTFTATPTRIPSPTPEPVGPARYLYTFDPLNETLQSLGFLPIPSSANVALNVLPIAPGNTRATNGEGLRAVLNSGEFVTVNGPSLHVSEEPVQITIWFNVSDPSVQFALGAYTEMEGLSGSAAYTMRSISEFTVNNWQQAKLEIAAGYTRITPFIALFNAGTRTDVEIRVDNLEVIMGEPTVAGTEVSPLEWHPNLWVEEPNIGSAYIDGTTLVMEKTAVQSMSRFVTYYAQQNFPNQVTVELDILRDYGDSGTLTIWIGNGPSAFQKEIPLWLLPQGTTKTVSISGVTTQASGFMHVVLQLSGNDDERIRIPRVKVYEKNSN